MCIMVESSKKPYPTRFMESLDIYNLKTDPCPASLSQFIRGVLLISHI